MKIESTASLVIPSGWKASIIISAACSRRGAWLRIPPLPMMRPRVIMLSKRRSGGGLREDVRHRARLLHALEAGGQRARGA